MGWEVDCRRMHVAAQITTAACPRRTGAVAAPLGSLIPARLLQEDLVDHLGTFLRKF